MIGWRVNPFFSPPTRHTYTHVCMCVFIVIYYAPVDGGGGQAALQGGVKDGHPQHVKEGEHLSFCWGLGVWVCWGEYGIGGMGAVEGEGGICFSKAVEFETAGVLKEIFWAHRVRHVVVRTPQAPSQTHKKEKKGHAPCRRATPAGGGRGS